MEIKITLQEGTKEAEQFKKYLEKRKAFRENVEVGKADEHDPEQKFARALPDLVPQQ